MENILHYVRSAMNTIPLTFNEHQINCTVLGGQNNASKGSLNICAVLLNKNGSHLHLQTIENLISCGFRSIISVEPNSESYNIEDMSKRFPSVKFIVPREKCTEGDLINLCMAETDSEYVFVLKDSLYIPQNFMAVNLAENLTKSKSYCVVPRLVSNLGESVSIRTTPIAERGRFRIISSQLINDGVHTIFPPDFIGLYNREKFIQLGGFDYTITSSYWQNVDLAMRSWLWGEFTVLSTKLAITYKDEVPVDNVTPNLSYLRFYLKNILPKYKADHGMISNLSFMNFFFNSSCGILEAISQFSGAKKWVKMHRYRFRYDAKYMIENWNNLK